MKASYLDDSNPHAGWKTTFPAAPSWVRFDRVDFERGRQKSVEVRAKAGSSGAIEIRLDRADGPVIARVEPASSGEWNIAKARAKAVPAGVHDLFVMHTGAGAVDVDWLRFR